ncbi:hypothetical protein HG535_0G01650 [Zygotorulaspora mrakii]|uniref:Impact N-terminal domain-containing protein n=1 Tax=Zygotorulaspora mrakii TaxID=42260 RepID=A0A7H9B6H7_ZYGMR|nr:uncharacterized protein HG535_0G01650 [Zygotorulaspora mrakii]QLG74281.1 hypothetical protein HG535_0G01650 [Zygotorulaspora mrakii]
MQSWNESEMLIDRKSKFQARCWRIQDQTEINGLLQKLVLENKSIRKASHPHMYAWRTGEWIKDSSNGKNIGTHSSKKTKSLRLVNPIIKNLQQGWDDNGEAAAGQRLLTLLERANIINVLIIVTRWYGGTPLGSSRFRHISSSAVQSLKRAKFLS